MDEAEAKQKLASALGMSVEEVDGILPSLIEALRTKTIRDASTSKTPSAPERIYYQIRVGQFETVVDSRDCTDSSEALDYATHDKFQPWYFVDDGKDEPVPLTTKWTHAQYADWLRRK